MCTESNSKVGGTNATNSDCWIGVEDPKKRKQIQDRLAQRARRKRLAEARVEADVSGQNNTASARRRRKKPAASPMTGAVIKSSSSRIPDDTPFLGIPLSVYTALWRNGQRLGLSCAVVVPSISRQYGPDIPDSLQPTGLQLVTVHPPWIDRFPFPQFRDNFISLLDVVDPEDFMTDLFSMPSFTLKEGGDSWDPAVWSVEDVFREKWGFLFDPSLF